MMKTETTLLLWAEPAAARSPAAGRPGQGHRGKIGQWVTGRRRAILGFLLIAILCFSLSMGYSEMVRPPLAQDDQLNQAAGRFATCMTDAGISASLTYLGDPPIVEVVAINPDSGRTVMWRQPGVPATIMQFVNNSFVIGPTTDQQMLFYFSFDPSPQLWIDSADRSADYRRCQEQTGYDADKAYRYATGRSPDSAQVNLLLKLYERAAENWIDCARTHGWTDVAADEVETGGYAVPVVDLPAWMSITQLTRLLQACSPDDTYSAPALQQWQASHDYDGSFPPDYVPAPMIRFSLDIGPLFLFGDHISQAMDQYWARHRYDLTVALAQAGG